MCFTVRNFRLPFVFPLHQQFHVKLADALRAVQNSEVGEDPGKAEGAMGMLDDFQQSIGNCPDRK